MSALHSSYFYWCLGLVCGIPLAIVFLNECIDRSHRSTGNYSNVLTTIRDIILPLLVVVVMLRFVFVVNEENVATRFLSTAFWLVLMLVVFRLARQIIGTGVYSAEDWRSVVPHMFLRLPPYTIMGLIIFHIVQNLWSLPIREMATTLGIGSIVIAFALQDTLSNLVSGVLLVANSPFKTGDWVHVGAVEGKISAVNWRYTNIETCSGDLVVIPNGTIAGESIENHSRPNNITSNKQRFKISFEHPPNKVSDLFNEVFKNCPGILASPAPIVSVMNIDDPAMEYETEYWLEDYGTKTDVHAAFMSRVWYALRRHGIALPTTSYDIQTFDGVKFQTDKNQRSQLLNTCVDWLPHFSRLPTDTRDHLAATSSFKIYAANEIILNSQDSEPGLCVIVTGSIKLNNKIESESGSDVSTEILQVGEFFGETGLFGRAISPSIITAIEDTEILCIPHDVINQTINRNPDFANSISTVINQRRAYKELIVPPYPNSDLQTPSSTRALEVENDQD